MTGHILMVDDEIDAQELFRQNFRREIRKGVYHFGFAESAEAALRALREANDAVGVVLSDINMPGMSGLELLEELHSTRPELPVMMITAYGDAETEAQVRELGGQRFLTKPVDFAHLRQALTQIFETAQ